MIESGRVNADPQRPPKKSQSHLGDWPDPAQDLDFLLLVRRYSTGLLHGVRLTGTRCTARCRVCKLPLHQLSVAFWAGESRSRLRLITTPITACISLASSYPAFLYAVFKQHFSIRGVSRGRYAIDLLGLRTQSDCLISIIASAKRGLVI